MGNTDIWDFAKETDPSGTKTGDLGGRVVTSINGTYMAKKATEMFGPIGIGWGYEIEEERYDPAGPIFDKVSSEKICDALNHTIKIRLWYKSGDKKGEVVQFGHTKYIYATHYGFKADDEAPKKSLTDAMKKCLSILGFCSDIYLGQFDDRDYVEAQKAREHLESADDKIEEKEKQRAERTKWLSDTLRLVSESTTLSMVNGICRASINRANARGDNDAVARIEKAGNDKKTILEEKGSK